MKKKASKPGKAVTIDIKYNVDIKETMRHNGELLIQAGKALLAIAGKIKKAGNS